MTGESSVGFLGVYNNVIVIAFLFIQIKEYSLVIEWIHETFLNLLLHHHRIIPSLMKIDKVRIRNHVKNVCLVLINLSIVMKVSVGLEIYIFIYTNIYLFIVSPRFAERLYKLKGYEIVFICDDSGSMTAPIGKLLNIL
jgi:hypothetical protein